MTNATDTTNTILPPLATKWWLSSLTVRGALLSAASAALPAFGAVIGIDLNGETVRQLGQHTTAIVQAVGGIAGMVLAIKGRTRAVTRLERRPVRVLV